jgi:hypothetical protein
MANPEPNDANASAVTKLPKKKYSPPTLTVYGNVREMTNLVGLNKALDGGTSSAKTAI